MNPKTLLLIFMATLLWGCSKQEPSQSEPMKQLPTTTEPVVEKKSPPTEVAPKDAGPTQTEPVKAQPTAVKANKNPTAKATPKKETSDAIASAPVRCDKGHNLASPKDNLRKIVKKRLEQQKIRFISCFVAAEKKGIKVEKKLQISLTLKNKGKVDKVQIKNKNMDQTLLKCLKRRFLSIRFPREEYGSTSFNHVLEF